MTQAHDVDTRILERLLDALPSPAGDDALSRFAELQRDYPLRGGKGLRGRLVVASALAHGAQLEHAIPIAAALELFQNWVLVHDDVEDGSETRRGAPALHRTVGIPVAINVGDAMHVAMWRLLIEADYPNREAILKEFGETITRTAEGQHLDLSWVEEARFDVDEADYLDMVERKTARYTIVAPLHLGALLAGVTPDPRLEPAGLALGAAFQIRDDVLNLLPDEGGYGKEFAGDLYEGKRTLILARALHTLPSEDAMHLTRLLNRERSEIAEADVRDALALIEQADALRYAQEVAERKLRDGMERIEAWMDSLPEGTDTQMLRSMLGSLASRVA